MDYPTDNPTTHPKTTKLEFGLLLMGIAIMGFLGGVIAISLHARIMHAPYSDRVFAASGLTFWIGVFFALAGQQQKQKRSTTEEDEEQPPHESL